MSFSISTQSGNFSYVAEITPTRNNHISFGFSNSGQLGASEKDLVFSGESGRLFDAENNFIGSYQSGESLIVSGNKFSGKHNYFINNELINSNSEIGSGYINLFKKNGVDCNVQLLGTKPQVSITGIFESAKETGLLSVKNLSEQGINFNCFSGSFTNAFNILNFETGQNTGIIEGQSERLFKIFKDSTDGTGTGDAFPLLFQTDFGSLRESGIITFDQSYLYTLSLLGLDNLFSTGLIDYTILFSERYGNVFVPDEFPLNFRVSSQSGLGNYADFDTTKLANGLG